MKKGRVSDSNIRNRQLWSDVWIVKAECQKNRCLLEFFIKEKFDDSCEFNIQILYQHKNEPVYHVVHFLTQLAIGDHAGFRKYPYALIAFVSD